MTETVRDQQRAWTADERRLARQMLPYLDECGWLASRSSGQSVDRDGNPIPWITYAAIAFLSTRTRPDMRVFEFGSGNSTLWWAQRVRDVRAVEHDEGWARQVARSLPPNATVSHVPLTPGGDYSRSASRTNQRFHVVVIDGRDRVNCALASTGSLRDDGVILWDNSERGRYQHGLAALAKEGFKRIGFRGLAPIGTWATETSLLYREGNCLGI